MPDGRLPKGANAQCAQTDGCTAIHPTTGLTCAMRMKTLYAHPVGGLFASTGRPYDVAAVRNLLYVNVRRSFQTIA